MISQFFQELIFSMFGNQSWLGIIILAMIPVTELRVAIPFAMNKAAWGIYTLTWWQAWGCAVLGSTLPAFFVIPLLIPFFNWLRKTKFSKKIVDWFDKRFSDKAKTINDKIDSNESKTKKASFKKFLGVVLFVSVPLPLTGAWTGSAIAAYLNMPYWQGVFAVLVGNIISGGIMLVLSIFFAGYEGILNIIFFSLIGVVVIGLIVLALVKRHRHKKLEKELNNQAE